MKKALIISLYGNNNYGNKLQNYALQRFLSKHNIDSEVLAYSIKRKKALKYNLSFAKVMSKIKLKINKKLIGNKWLIDRKNNFDKFNKKIKYTTITITNLDELKSIINQYDMVVVGSDQIWGLGITQIPEIAFSSLTEASTNIAFSASFGIDDIPTEYIDRYRKGLKNFKAISVRENEGAKIVKEITGADVDVIVDPTMLVNVDEWDSLIEKPNFIGENEKYILTYFVETCSKERKKAIKNVASKHDFKVIALNDFDNKFAYSIGPMEFLYLIKNSEMVYTDSFHCCVFSILFGKNFNVLKRMDTNGKTNSRIRTLLDKFELNDRSVDTILDEITNCDYNNKKKILREEQEKAENFIKNL